MTLKYDVSRPIYVRRLKKSLEAASCRFISGAHFLLSSSSVKELCSRAAPRWDLHGKALLATSSTSRQGQINPEVNKSN